MLYICVDSSSSASVCVVVSAEIYEVNDKRLQDILGEFKCVVLY